MPVCEVGFLPDVFDNFICLLFASWAEQNVDPSLFSKELMANASSLVQDFEVVISSSFFFE